jgi:hypothetical protein
VFLEVPDVLEEDEFLLSLPLAIISPDSSPAPAVQARSLPSSSTLSSASSVTWSSSSSTFTLPLSPCVTTLSKSLCLLLFLDDPDPDPDPDTVGLLSNSPAVYLLCSTFSGRAPFFRRLESLELATEGLLLLCFIDPEAGESYIENNDVECCINEQITYTPVSFVIYGSIWWVVKDDIPHRHYVNSS